MGYPTTEEPATSQYVLAVLRDMLRQQCQYDREAEDVSLSLDASVAEWREACCLFSWRELGRAQNQIWDINCPDAEWQAVLEPAHEKRLAGVCDLIARHARRSRFRPARLFGCTCTAAGAFLTVRSLLHEAGACATEIAPSTPLAPYTRRYCELFLGPISRLTPGALPLVRIRTPVYDAAIWGCLAGMICFLGGACSGLHLLTAAGALVLVVAYPLTWIAARSMLPASVEFGELRTFRDLAAVLAEGSAPERGATADGHGKP
jgi:hypothetical protein